jgi:hypothetical protein
MAACRCNGVNPECRFCGGTGVIPPKAPDTPAMKHLKNYVEVLIPLLQVRRYHEFSDADKQFVSEMVDRLDSGEDRQQILQMVELRAADEENIS